MSAPPLPEAFGNYALGDFVEVVAPAVISWLPQTPGWYVVGTLAVLLLLRGGWRRLRRWWRNRYRREALARLADAGVARSVTELNRLLKLTALAAWPRPRVAGLTGSEWVDFLNSRCPAPPFDDSLAGLLCSNPYTGAVPDEREAARLAAACRDWISGHRGPVDD